MLAKQIIEDDRPLEWPKDLAIATMLADSCSSMKLIWSPKEGMPRVQTTTQQQPKNCFGYRTVTEQKLPINTKVRVLYAQKKFRKIQ